MCLAVCSLLGPIGVVATERAASGVSDTSLRDSVARMKTQPKGPFESVRWFCADGEVLLPTAYACREHGGGIQHGVLSKAALELRARGFRVANVLASLEPARFVGPEADLDGLHQLVVERFLIGWDDGWIFRGARSYRGALQIEDEEAASEKLLLALLGDESWLAPERFLLLRELARLLPLQARQDTASRVRALAAELGDADADFQSLRARIHSTPNASDSGRVRAYARGRAQPERYEALAREIDELFDPKTTSIRLEPLLPRIGGELGKSLRADLSSLASRKAVDRIGACARGLESVRRALPKLASARGRLAALKASLVLEAEAFSSGQAALADENEPQTRRSRLALLEPLATSLYGTGLIGDRQLSALREELERFRGHTSVPLGEWRRTLSYLARAPEWSRRALIFHFGAAVEKFGQIEIEAAQYQPDRLRGSSLLAYSLVLDPLLLDAQRRAGTTSRVLGSTVGMGIRSLNPGVARGVLRRAGTSEEIDRLPPDSVALLPETVSQLPPVAAILTSGEGSSLSHVQLLARNLGIPNAVLSDSVAARLLEELGQPVEVAVSAGGVVQIDRIKQEDLPQLQSKPDADLVIRVDEKKLDLERTAIAPLASIGTADSGIICGPKAANLGQLRRHFGDAVPDGFVIPFGAFRVFLQRPIEVGGPSAFDWLREGYRGLRSLDGPERSAAASALLARIREWILFQDVDDTLRADVAQGLAKLGSGGVFVRSDTNVEDLPGFTGAGLNLTVPNVVGLDAVLDAMLRVWASPFSDRAFAWRQSHMPRPELVFPSVLVQRAFPAEKSGVMITVDVDTGDPGWLSVAVSEGVGGAVDGQAAESIRIDRDTGQIRFLAQATAPTASELDPRGGVRIRPASGAERLLQPEEAMSLVSLAGSIDAFPALRNQEGGHLAADVEFAFRKGSLALLQIRPFVENRRARASKRLQELDAPSQRRNDEPLPLDAPLEGGSQ